MALSAWQATIVNESGDVIPSASIEVINEDTGLTATIYANAGGGSLGNPFSAGTNGFARFYADAGSYTITASDAGSGFSESFNNVRLGNAQGYDVGAGAGQIPRNDDLPTFGTAATTNTGTAAGEVPTNANLSASIAGTATFSGDVYTFSPSGTGFRPLQAGMYLSFRLPSGSSNTTTTPDISYNGTTYVIKWIDGSALVADDLSETYNKQPILFYFDGTDMLISSDISGSNANGEWVKKSDGAIIQMVSGTQTVNITSSSTLGGYLGDSASILYPKGVTTNVHILVTGGPSCGDVAPFVIGSGSFSLRFRTINSNASLSVDFAATITDRWY